MTVIRTNAMSKITAILNRPVMSSIFRHISASYAIHFPDSIIPSRPSN